ncbi:unnamed protein product [Adineta ricciae]|uniref:J domain-containing protein n=1 Tax=Adineta ricciae TaxID=249248 RepID=A0A815UKQ7_ADIRI|nr:unnamed protein product [Adineta ricciae]CAF1521210.1 unnamed protein product [Adineta ricciae]
MEAETAIFQQIVFTEALTTPNWRRYFSYLSDAGIATIEDFLETSNSILNELAKNIPSAPLNRIRTLRDNLIKIKSQCNNSFTEELGAISFFHQFEFIPHFTCEQYLADIPMENTESEIRQAKNKITTIDYTGLTKYQAIFIALYCQEASNQNRSFYYLTNQFLRERNEKLICMRSSLFLLESGLRSLPSIREITWRGMNTAPDLGKIIVGKTICFTGICSTSRDKNQTLCFMNVPPNAGLHKRTLLKLYMTHGVSIQQWSCYQFENEVVASFCSRWKVLRVEQNRDETFDNGVYHCDYYIVLHQLSNEPLFRSDTELTGLYLLSKIEYEKPSDLHENFKEKFLDLFNQLNDATAKDILESVLSNTNYWNEENKGFKNNPENKEIFQVITHFLEGVKSLSSEFQHHGINLRKAFEICEIHRIYATIRLFYEEDGAERTIEDLQQLGFDTESAKKIYNQEYVKQELQLVYKKLNYYGTVDSPQNVSKWLCKLRLNHYIMRDGVMVSAYELAHVSVNGAKRIFPRFRNLFNGSIQFDNYRYFGKSIGYEIQYSDFAIAGIIFAVQFGMHSVQLWHGDITTRQFIKSIATSAVSVVAGFSGGATAGWFAAGCAGLLGLASWPAGLLVLVGTAAGGLVCGGGADYVIRRLMEKYFPDGEAEELNAQRKLYCAALTILACNPDSTMRKIQQAYYRKAQATHPDKCDNKAVAEEEFKKVTAAYEIAKNYHEVLENACKTLGIPNEFTIEQVKMCKNTVKNNDELKRAYNIVYRHLVYNSNKWKKIRNWLDSDQNLKLNDSAPLPITKS